MSSLDDQPAENQSDGPDDLIDLDLRQRLAIAPPHGRGICTEPFRFTISPDDFGKWLEGEIGLVDPDLVRAEAEPRPWKFHPIERTGRVYSLRSKVDSKQGVALVDLDEDIDGLPLLPNGSDRFLITAVVRIPRLSPDDWVDIPEGWAILDELPFVPMTRIRGEYLVALIELRPVADGCIGKIDYLPVVKRWIDVLKTDDGSPWRDAASPPSEDRRHRGGRPIDTAKRNREIKRRHVNGELTRLGLAAEYGLSYNSIKYIVRTTSLD